MPLIKFFKVITNNWLFVLSSGAVKNLLKKYGQDIWLVLYLRCQKSKIFGSRGTVMSDHIGLLARILLSSVLILKY